MPLDEFPQGRTLVRLNTKIDAATLVWCLTDHLENFPLSHPGAFSKKQVPRSLIHTLVSADTSALTRSLLSCDFPDKTAPGAQHLHQLLSQHAPAGGPGVGHVVVNPPCPGFSTSLIWTTKSQPSLLPLITQVPPRLPCPLGSSNLRLSGWFTIIDTQLKDYLVTLQGFCFVCLQRTMQACIK